MIPALRQLQPGDASRVVALTIQRLLPSPVDLGPDAVPASVWGFSEQVLRDLKSEFGVVWGPVPEAVRVKILNRLGDEITVLANLQPARTEIQARLGERGDLPIDQYEIEFNPMFDEYEGRRGIRRAQVVEAIRHSDVLQELLPERTRKLGMTLIEYFAKKIERTKTRAESWLLITALRRGRTLAVQCVWRIFPSDIPAVKEPGPIGLLKSFVGAYGIPVAIPGGPESKLFWDVDIATPPNFDPRDPFDFIGDTSWQSHIVARPTESGRLYVLIGYAIDLIRYHDDLQKQHLPLEPPPPHLPPRPRR